MIHTYTIKGMTCNNCKASVIEYLKTIEDVQHVIIDLQSEQAYIESTNSISLDRLQAVLPKKYSILKPEINSNYFQDNDDSVDNTSDIKQLFPLFLIFAFIIGAALLLNKTPWNSTGFMLDFMGLFYVVFSFFKFLDLKGFPESFRMYDPLAKALPVYAWIYPFIELGLGLLFLMRFGIKWALIITLIVLGITTFGVTKSLFSKNKIRCACLGTALKLPMTKATFIENSIMIVMAIIMLINLNN